MACDPGWVCLRVRLLTVHRAGVAVDTFTLRLKDCKSEMTPEEITIAGIGFLAAGFVKGATGVGYATTALPIVALAIGLDRAMPLVLIPSLASNVMVMRAAGEFKQTWARFWPLFAALLPGLVLGLAALATVNTSTAARILGLVILAYALYALLRPHVVIPSHLERPLNIPVGVVNGFINGLTGSQIMPCVPYALSLRLSPDGVVQLTNICFTLSSLVMMAGLHHIGLLDAATLAGSAAGIVPAFIGVTAGSYLRTRLPPAAFRKGVLLVLMALAALLIVGR